MRLNLCPLVSQLCRNKVPDDRCLIPAVANVSKWQKCLMSWDAVREFQVMWQQLPEDHFEQVKHLFLGALISQFCQNETETLDHYSVTLMLIANIDLFHGMWRSSEHREHRRCIPENLHWFTYQWDFPSKRMYFCAFWPESRATTSFGFVRRSIPENLCVLALRPK